MRAEAPLISVVVPVYNTAALLGDCLESLVTQTYRNLEIIVVDDGSTDQSAETARGFQERTPGRLLVIQRPHSGRAAARQSGVDAATGEYVGFVDADDWADVHMYERMHAQCAEDDSIDVVVCKYRNVMPDGHPGFVYEEGDDSLYGGGLVDHVDLLGTVEASLCNKLFRRSLFGQSVRFPPGKDFEDLATTYRLMAGARRIAKVAGPPLYYYRAGGPVSVMSAHDHRYADLVDAIEVNCTHFREQGLYPLVSAQLLRLALRHLIFGRFGDFFIHGRRTVKWRYLDRAYAMLDAEFPGWRQSEALRELSHSRRSLALVRSRWLMKLFVGRPSVRGAVRPDRSQ